MRRLLLILSVLFCLGLIGQAASCETIGQAKAKSDGASVSVVGSVTYTNPQEFYIESTDRSSGIWALGSSPDATIGNVVSVTGTLSTISGERVISDAQVSPSGSQLCIKPVGMQNKWIGGANRASSLSIQDFLPFHIPGDGSKLQWKPAVGLCNTGLLVTTWGIVNAVYYSPTTSAKWFYIDDGFGAVSDYGDQGILVYSDADVKEYNFVKVTGISSVEPSFDDSSKLIRVLRPRGSSDVTIYADDARPNLYPFSDEFNDSVLNKLWSVGWNVSLTANPGYLTMDSASFNRQVAQEAPGDWDMDTKFSFRFASGINNTGYFRISLGDTDLIFRYSSLTPLPANYNSVVVGPVQSAFTDSRVHSIGAFNSDTCYIRIRNRGGILRCSISNDGIQYTPEISYSASFKYLTLMTDYSYNSTMSTLIDFIRFTKK